MTITTWLYFGGGLVLLVGGADLLVRGASRLALLLGLSPLVIGLTLVAAGTSAPEIAVSVKSSLEGRSDLAVGNVVGSNVFNVLLILGLSALLRPLVVTRHLIRWDVPIMLGVSVTAFALALDGSFSRAEGLGLLLGGVAYLVFLMIQSRFEPPAAKEALEAAVAPRRPARGISVAGLSLLLVAAGLGALVLGSHWLVESAVNLARALGVSELVIAVTVVAAGTSLPELATSVVATLRGERDIAIGNVVGSNIFNVLVVLGAAAAVTKDGLVVSPVALRLDLPIMVAVALACLPIFFTGHRISRLEGLFFLTCYAGYTGYLVLQSKRHPAMDELVLFMLGIVIPISLVAIGVSVIRALREGPS